MYGEEEVRSKALTFYLIYLCNLKTKLFLPKNRQNFFSEFGDERLRILIGIKHNSNGFYSHSLKY